MQIGCPQVKVLTQRMYLATCIVADWRCVEDGRTDGHPRYGSFEDCVE